VRRNRDGLYPSGRPPKSRDVRFAQLKKEEKVVKNSLGGGEFFTGGSELYTPLIRRRTAAKERGLGRCELKEPAGFIYSGHALL